MRFQERDGRIIRSIHENGGVLARRHLKALFWPGKTWRAMERRLSKLHQGCYIDWPGHDHRRTHPIPEPICWLGWRGALFIAGQRGVAVKVPTGANENQLRLLDRGLRKHGIRWVREPRWSLLGHDLAVVDFRLAVERSIGQLPSLHLGRWIPESEFRSNTDVVSCVTQDKDGNPRQRKKGVCPDGYFEVVDDERRRQGNPHKARFLLEVDMATHDNPRFGREKVMPGVAYIHSPSYRARFGSNNGRWLVVTHGDERRMSNLMRQTRQAAGTGSNLFLFTTFAHLEVGNVLTGRVWWQVGQDEPAALIAGAAQT